MLDEDNFQRQGKHFFDQESPLTCNQHVPIPCILVFECSENREGYWAYNNMVLQLEDAVNVL